MLLKLLTAQVGGFSKDVFVVITCQSIFREGKAQNENNELPNEAASERQQENCQKRPISHKYLPKQKCLQKHCSQIIEVQIMHLYASHY